MITVHIGHTGRAGYHPFHFNPEANVGSGGIPDGESLTGDELRRTAIPDSTTTTTTTTTGSGATPDPETESTTTTH